MMKTVIAFLALVAAAVAIPQYDFEPFSDAQIYYINNVAKTTWKAGHNFQPKDLERVKAMLGYDVAANREYIRRFVPTRDVQVNADLPSEFDPRQKWTKCTSLNVIRDQSACGSCWAFGSVEAMSDRICIKGGGNVSLSANDVNSCCDSCGNGCGGGFPSAAYQYYQHTGIVTGGLYGTKDVCSPYVLPPCDHHTKGKYKPCGPEGPTPPCKKQCQAGYNKTFEQDKHYGKSTYSVQGEEKIMTELVNNGPVTTGFSVYADFPTYKSGVYQHTSGGFLGGHAVKIMGYGVESGTKYWLVANSWNPDWGMKGYFKIRRGTDECGIESDIVTGEPKL